jgi:hypothetical protein
VLEGTGEAHLPQRGPAAASRCPSCQGVRQAWWPDSRKSGAPDRDLEGGSAGRGTGRSAVTAISRGLVWSGGGALGQEVSP